jgi:CxxC motif-containing protein (DUF1111 family)
MQENILTRTRRRCGAALAVLAGILVVTAFAPGLPVLWEPRASARERAEGQTLFVHEWRPHDSLSHGDGLGPVYNASSCAACHFQGGVGGGGGNDHNVMAFEAHPTKDRPDVQGGLIHKYAVTNRFMENSDSLRKFFPIVPGGIRVKDGCSYLVRDFDPVKTESVNATALFGAGWIDRISPKTIVQHNLKTSIAGIGRELNLDFDGIGPGRPRVLPDGRVGKFGWKAQFATLEEFVAAACANEIGLGNPRMEQAKPWVRWEYPKMAPDLNGEQFHALVAFVDTLPRPVEIVPSDTARHDLAAHGKALFNEVGCVACHVPDMGGVPGIYSDFLLHRLDDRSKGGRGYSSDEASDVPLPQDHPLPEEWKTPPLWGVADSAPYLHDGKAATLEAAIDHHHGDAEPVLRAYGKLGAHDRAAVVAFLKTLKAPREAEPVPANLQKSLASAR